MRKRFWFLLALVAVAVVVFSVIGIKRLRAWSTEREASKLPKEEMLSAEDAPKPILVDEYGDPVTAEPGAVSRYMLSEEYANLSAKEKQAFQDQVVAAYSDPAIPSMGPGQLEVANMTEAQREYLQREGEPVMQRVEDTRMSRFFDLSEADQNAILDATVDRIEARMAAYARSGSSGRGGRGGDRPPVTDYPTHHLRRHNMGSPEGRAQRQEYWRRLNARMEERGVQAPWHR